MVCVIYVLKNGLGLLICVLFIWLVVFMCSSVMLSLIVGIVSSVLLLLYGDCIVCSCGV